MNLPKIEKSELIVILTMVKIIALGFASISVIAFVLWLNQNYPSGFQPVSEPWTSSGFTWLLARSVAFGCIILNLALWVTKWLDNGKGGTCLKSLTALAVLASVLICIGWYFGLPWMIIGFSTLSIRSFPVVSVNSREDHEDSGQVLRIRDKAGSA